MNFRKSDLASFGLGLSNFIYFKSFGLIILLEVIAILLFILIFIFAKNGGPILKVEGRRFPKKFYFLGFIWLIGQFISDSINHSDPTDTKKLIAQIVIILVLVYWAQNWF